MGYSEETLRHLLEKYFEGETTLGEEEVLKEYFTASDTVPEGLEYASHMFSLFIERGGETAGLPGFVPAKGKKSGIPGRRFLLAAASVAAVIALVSVLVFGIRSADTGTVYCYYNGEPVYDKETAVSYASETLEYVAGSFEKPMKILSILSEVEKVIGVPDNERESAPDDATK